MLLDLQNKKPRTRNKKPLKEQETLQTAHCTKKKSSLIERDFLKREINKNLNSFSLQAIKKELLTVLMF